MKDANSHTTYYTRGANIGEITQIKHHDNTHIDYTYYNEGNGYISGHYLQQMTDERRNITYYRDGNNRVTYTGMRTIKIILSPATDYAYNSFGQVSPHLLEECKWCLSRLSSTMDAVC